MAGADASIYNMLRPPQAGPGPLDQFAQGMQIRNMMGAGETQALQQQQIRQQMADAPAAQARARDEEALKADKEFFTAMTPKMRDMLAGVRDDQSLAGYRDSAMKFAGMFRSPQYREMLMAGAQQIPQRFDPAWWEQNLRSADQVVSGIESARGRKTTERGQDMTAATAAAGQRQAASEGALNRGVTVRGQDLVNQRAIDSAGTDKFGEPKEVTGPDGKPRLVMQNKRTGELVDANTRQPVSGVVGPKAGETAQKQLTGVTTTKDAIAEYREALKNWGATDIINPNARARMGTVYNNMMLQAKEAYNLGVLNGPDYMILQEVITSPSSLTGGITSKEALDDQAKKLDEIMTRIGSQVTATQSGVATPAAAAPKPAAVAAPKLGHREGGYIYKGGDPSKPSSWEKAR
jgi:hypothetical protein